MKNILAFSGSNSSNSINQALVKYVSTLVENNKVNVISLVDYDLPLYNIDIEKNEGIPFKAKALIKLFNESDGFIISTPEHNSSIPAFFKNTIDWLSRIEKDVFKNKAILLMSTSPGPGAAKNALTHAEQIFSGYLTGNIVETFSLPFYTKAVDTKAEGIRFVDIEMINTIKEKLTVLEEKL
jgi:NAD(P)H-dependent FMN reductase